MSSATSSTRSGSSWSGLARATDLADAHADSVVQSAVRDAIGLVEDRTDDLASTRRICAAVAVQLEHDRCAVVGLDDGSEVGLERTTRALPPWEIRATEPPAHLPFAAALRKVEVLLPAALEADLPALGIGEAEPIKGREPHEGPPHD